MFDAMNEGKIRVLFGSTQKLGTGVNAQQRIVCMHHLDIPWRPMDLEQRNGRGARKGNIVAKEYAGNKVKAYVYAVLRTLDAYKLNLLHNKQQFIDQLKRNRLGARRLDEGAISEDSGMNFAEWMAVVSGNTDLLQKAKLEGRIAALESEQTIFMRTRHEAQSQLQRYTAEIGRRDAMLERLKRDWDYINEVAPLDAKGKRANPLRIDGVESADIVAHGKRLVEIDRTVNTGALPENSARCSISAFSSAPSECRKTGWRSRSINSWSKGWTASSTRSTTGIWLRSRKQRRRTLSGRSTRYRH